MSMGTLGRAMKSTRTKMIENHADTTADLFHGQFGMRDGDYIEFTRFSSSGTRLRTTGRIMLVENCWYNSLDGYTALIKVAPLLIGGSLGNTRTIMVAVDSRPKSKGKISGPGDDEVFRVDMGGR